MWLLLLACSGAPSTSVPLDRERAAEVGVRLDQLGVGAPQQQLAVLPGILRIDGILQSACPGRVRVDVLEKRDAAGPLTTLELWPGALRFQILAPASERLSVTAVCDANADGVLDTEHDRVTELVELGAQGTGHAIELHLDWE